MGNVGVGISHKHFLLQPGQAGENEQGMFVRGSLKSAHCRKQAPLKPFFIYVRSYNLKQKTSAVLPCSLLSKYSDSAIPCVGQECG